MATLSPEEERRLKSEYGDIFGGLLSSSVTPVASSEFTKIAHEPRFADTLSPERLAEITATIAPKVDTFEAHPDVKLDRWATEGVPGPGSAIHDYDPRTDTTIISPPTLTIPEVDTFKELSSAAKTSPVLYSPFAGDVPPPEPFKAESFMEKYPRPDSGTSYPFGEEKGRGSYTGFYEPEEGTKLPYEVYDGYGRPFVIGPDGSLTHKELAPLLWDFLEKRHNIRNKTLAAARNDEINAYWGKVDSRTKQIEDYIKSSGITAEEYSKRSTAASPLKSDYVKDHPDYEELVREAVPTLDERLDAPDYPLERPWSAPPSDPEKAIAEALAPVKLEIGRDTVDDLESSISTATVEAARILEDMGLVPTGEGAPDYLGTVIKDRDGGYGVKSPGLGLGGDTKFKSGEAYRDVLEHALGAATVGEPAMDAREHYLALTGEESVDPMDLATHAAVAGLSPTEAARAVTGEAVRRIVDPSAPYASARSPEVLETKFEDAFGSSKLDSERLPISFTAGMGHEAEREAYLSRGSDIPSGISSVYAAPSSGMFPTAAAATVPLAPRADPYPGIIDPTFAPDASIHYTDPLKHYDTETVPGHLPLSLTTPYATAVEGMEHAAEFAPPEWSYPAMPPPSVYSRPDMEPSAPVDDFSSMYIPSPSDLRGFEGPMSYPSDPRSPSLSYDYSGYGDPVISWYWPDGRVERISEEMVKEGWKKHAGIEPLSDEARLAEAMERLASIPAGFVGGPEKTMTRIDATGGPLTPFGGVGDYTTPGGFYTPITPLTGITPPTFSSDFWDPSTTPVDPLAAVWT